MFLLFSEIQNREVYLTLLIPALICFRFFLLKSFCPARLDFEVPHGRSNISLILYGYDHPTHMRLHGLSGIILEALVYN